MKITLRTCLAMALVLVTILSLVSCGGNSDTPATSNNKTQTAEPATNNTQKTTEDNSQLAKTEETITLTKFQQFENGLTEKNIQFEVNQKAATMVGAKEGYGYSFADDTSVEVYLFDKSTDAYKEAFKNNKLNLVDFGITMDVLFNDDICIYFNGESANKADIQAVFENIK